MSVEGTLLSDLTAGSALDGSELLYAVQGGANRKITTQQIADFTGTGGGTIDNTTDLLVGDGAGNATAAVTGNITSSDANALTVGRQGATDPALKVNASAATCVTGIEVIAGAAGAGSRINAISSGTNENLTLTSKGTTSTATLNGGNTVVMQLNGNNTFTATNSQISYTNISRSSTTNTAFLWTSIASGTTFNSITAGTESLQLHMNLAATQTHASNTALTLSRSARVTPVTEAFQTATGTITNAAGWSVDGAPIAGTNCAITNSSTFYSEGRAVGSGVTNSYGINITANTGATNNYAAKFTGAIDLAGAGAGTSGQVLTSGGAGASCTWETPGGGPGGATESVTLDVTQTAHGFSAGDVLYHDGADYALALADAAATADVVGIVTSVAGANDFTMTLSGVATLSGLTEGQYFLDDTTPGLATLTPPSADGSIWKPLFIATSATEALVNIGTGTVVSSAIAGTVTSVGVASANGFTASVANSTTTPVITMQTSITGLLKGNGTAISAATASTDYLIPGGPLGTPSSGTLTNCTGLPLASVVGAGTLASQSGTFSGTHSGTSSGTNTGDQNIFQTISVAGQSDVVADSTTDTLTLIAGTNITIGTNASLDTITISSSGSLSTGQANMIGLRAFF